MSGILSFLLSDAGLLAAMFSIAASLVLLIRKSGKDAAEARQMRKDLDAAKDRLEMDREATADERRAAGMSDDEAKTEAVKWAKR